METLIPAFTLGLALAGALITFGMLYGVIKTRQQIAEIELKGVKSEFKSFRGEVRREFQLFRQSCHRLCRYAPSGTEHTGAVEELPIVEDFENTGD